jgi:predicted permease
MSGVNKDIRYALRQLRKAPGFSLTAILTLAFGIGATTAIFSIVEGVLLRPLPFADPSRLVVVGDLIDGSGDAGISTPSATAQEIPAYSEQTHALASVGGYQQTTYELAGNGEPAQINATRQTAGVFSTLGVAPLLGRVFTAQEETERQHLAVISYAMWHNRFHDDAQILQKTIELDRKPYSIIGVMPRSFEFPLVPGQLNQSELWVPLSLTATEIAQGWGSWNYNMVGRLKPGVTPAAAAADAQRVPQAMALKHPELSTVKLRTVVEPLRESTVADARPQVRMLFLAVMVVLGIACANLAGLLLVRVIRRRREFAVRMALGANAGTIVRQGLIETLALSVSGGLLGLALATLALRLGVRFLPESLPRIEAIGVDWRVALFALSIAVVTGVVCGLLPAFAASRTRINEGLKEGGRTGSSGGSQARLRGALVVGEIAVALVLMVASGLLLRSFEKLRAVHLGFRTDHLLSAAYALPRQQYGTQAAVDAFNTNLLQKLEQLPGVESAGLASQLMAAGQDRFSGFVAEGYTPPKGKSLNMAWPMQVVGDYFKAQGIPVLRGRTFTQADTVSSPLVVMVNKTLAERFWPGQDPIGKRIHFGVAETSLPWMRVVGEIDDVKQSSAEGAVMAQIYQPAVQQSVSFGQFAGPDALNGNGGYVLLRASLPPEQMASQLEAVVRSIDPRLPLTQVESMEQVVSEGQASRRFNMLVLSSFAGAAVLLAVMGIYSVIAFSATLRTQEMAIRLALGAQRASVMQMVLASGAKLGLIGCGVGAVVAIFATRLLRSMLFEVDPLDPVVLSLAVVAIFALAIVASLIPARRVAQVDPVEALRGE